MTGAATDPQLVDELGLQLSRYEGPTGIVGVLLDSCRRAGIPSVSLWAAVPHYVQLAPNPPAAKALCERLGGVLATEIDVSELAEASDEYVEQVSQAVATDADTAGYVEELEHRADSLDCSRSRTISRRAMRSRPRSRASCAIARRTTTRRSPAGRG